MAAPNILCNTKGMDRKTWLACRAHGPDGSIPIALGGSDIAAVFGLNPWKTPLDLWMEKAGTLMPDESENMWQKEMGHLLEPIVARMYAFRTGNTVIEDHISHAPAVCAEREPAQPIPAPQDERTVSAAVNMMLDGLDDFF